jgi:hypothetical protein
MDIVVGSLCKAYRHLTRFDESGHWVNMLFDHETDLIKVDNPESSRGLLHERWRNIVSNHCLIDGQFRFDT